MSISIELPDRYYPMPPVTITPCAPTPNHTLYLTNLDDALYMRVRTNFVCIFKKSVGMDILKFSLSRVLVDYYPIAGRFRKSIEDENKLVIDCNGEGALFAEASMKITVEELLTSSMIPNSSWNKFINMKVQNLIDTPPLIIQVTCLPCGGMILCASISHIMCDGIGASQFLNAWAQLTNKCNSNLTIIPFHDREILKIREHPQVSFIHLIYTQKSTHPNVESSFLRQFHTQSRVPRSFTYGANEILCLKKQCMKLTFKHITNFEVIAAHMWRSLVKACNFPLSYNVKLCFPVNFRNKMKLPTGYYGNRIVFACAESTVKDLVVSNNLHHCVKLVQQAKATVDEEYVKSTIGLLKEKMINFDGSIILMISEWSKLGLTDIDFGEGKPLHVGSLSMNSICMFLPVNADLNAIRVLLSVPKDMVEMFEHYAMNIESWAKDE